MPTQQSWFNSDMWRNHYLRTQKMGATAGNGQMSAATMSPSPPVPTIPTGTPGAFNPNSTPTVQPPPTPQVLPSYNTQNPSTTNSTPPLTAAEIADRARAQGAGAAAGASSAAAQNAGTASAAAQASAMAAASNQASSTASAPLARTTPAPASTLPPPTAPAMPNSMSGPNAAAYDNLQGDILKQMAAGVNGTPLPGTEAALRQGRERVAQYAKSMEAQAGARAAKNGSLGQGTANTLADDTKVDVLGKLSENEQNAAQTRSNEQQALIEKATQAVQFNQNLSQQQTESYRNQLERLSQDNPILASKLTNYLLEGKTGSVGNFTETEKKQLQDYVSKKQGQDDQLTAVMNKVLAGLPAQVDASNQTIVDAKTKSDETKVVDTATKTLNTLKPGTFLNDTDFHALQESGNLPRVSEQTIPRSSEGVQDFLTKNPSGIVSINGTQYRLVSGGTERTGAGTFSNQERHTDYATVVDPNGVTKYVYDGKIQDKPPKKVSNDISPFGF